MINKLERELPLLYKYLISTLCICSTMSLYAEHKGLGDMIQEIAKKKALVKSSVKNNKSKKSSRFVFKDEYNENNIAKMNKNLYKDKSKSYNNKNKSRFKFKFNDGSQQSNLIGRYGSGGMNVGMRSGGQGRSGAGRR